MILFRRKGMKLMRKFYVLSLNNNVCAYCHDENYDNSRIMLGEEYENDMLFKRNGLPFSSIIAEEINGKMTLLFTGDTVEYVPRDESLVGSDNYVEVESDVLSYYDAKEVCPGIVFASLTQYEDGYAVERFIQGIEEIKTRNMSLHAKYMDMDKPLCLMDDVNSDLEYIDKFSKKTKKMTRVIRQLDRA